eukprot:CAMPEP_0198141154 /NCGR_PEP_ID=MMETSP1443-20131203/4206_1 /TAXON_ID=186043 /ORGANISM="Entomoneis sp., Strain CCMP2396" /LENGTH=187 /DNA_ID=CAMNT_0043803803 /DNA_START=156 /DNA_END=716 /DNA_ORIENTATION=-
MATPNPPFPGSGSCEMNPQDFAAIQSLPGNMQCVECGSPKPDWGSPKLGILFCFQCSGRHRGLGTHISFVRSVTMDSWTEKQIAQMKAGGNDKCEEFLTSHGVSMSSEAREKYDTPAAELYRQVLLARVEGKPEPTELPKAAAKAQNVDPNRYKGFGSSPPPKKTSQGSGMIILLAVVIMLIGVALW